MDKILITGVAGFIGSNLAKHLLLNEENFVFGIDNFSHSTMSNLYPLLKNERFEFIEHDLNSEIPFQVDYIYHFAGNGDLSAYYQDKYSFTLNKINITQNIISYCKKSGAKLIFPTRYIDKSKPDFELYFSCNNVIENLLLDQINNNFLNAVIVRLDSVYGENQYKNDNRFIIQTVQKALLNEDFTINEDESYYFTYVQDVILNLEKIMKFYCGNNIIDVINPNLYLKSDIIKLICSYLKSNSKISINSQIQKHPTFTPVVINDFRCETAILDGLIKSIKHFMLVNYS